MATNLMSYANRHTAPARYRTSGGTHSIPDSGRHAPTLNIAGMSGKPAAGGAPLASHQVAAAIQEAGPEAMSITDNIAATQPQMVTETQQPIENRGIDPRFMIQGNGPRIDLSGLFPERANKSYDPSKAIGGKNVPYQASGFFRGLMGDPANRKNIEAQLAQGAEWKADAKEKAQEERLLNRMREADKPTQSRFEATQASGRESEANRVAAENKRIALEGERLGLTKQQIQDAKEARIADQQTKRQEMLDRVTQNQTENDLQRESLAQRLSVANYPHVVPGEKGSYSVVDPVSGKPLGNFSSGNLEMVKDADGNMVPRTSQGKWNPYVTPAKVPANLGGGGTVNRADGSTLGGALTTPTRFGEVSIGSEELPPGGLPDPGVVNLGGKLPPAPQNTALVPRFMRGAGDVMGGVMTSATDPLRYAGKEMYRQLLSSGAQQDPEVLKRLKKREEESSPWDIQ